MTMIRELDTAEALVAFALDTYGLVKVRAALEGLTGHGTVGGYELHRLQGQTPCKPCANARALALSTSSTLRRSHGPVA